MNDSDNLRPPDFGPQFPVYPEVCELVRVTGPAVAGTAPPVYPCQVVQFDSASLTSRNRETSYVVEPNSFPLTINAIYDARLVSAFQNLPLYATSCCVLVSASSSSSKSSSH